MSTFNISENTLILNKIYRLLAGDIHITLTNQSILTTQPINTTFSQIQIDGTSSSYHFDITYDVSGLFALVNDAGTHPVGHDTFTRNLQITGAIAAGTHSIGVETTDAIGRTFINYFNIVVT